MTKVAAVGRLAAAEKEEKGQRKTDNRNYQQDNRQTSSNGAVPNNANHYERWEKHVRMAIIVRRHGRLCVTFVRRAN
jgi:hypothetical protein